MFAHQFGRVVGAGLQGGDHLGGGGCVAQCHGDVAQPAFMADAPDCRAFQVPVEGLFIPLEKFHQLRLIQALARIKIRLLAGIGKAVPGTVQLAVVTTVNPIAHRLAQCHRDRSLQFNRQIGDATPGIDHIGFDDGLGGADIDAGLAGAAMVAGRLIHRQGQIGIQLAEKKPGAGMPL